MSLQTNNKGVFYMKVCMADENLYQMMDNLIPNPYTPNRWYELNHKDFPKIYRYFGMRNRLGYIHIAKVREGSKGIYLERFSFNKKHELKYGGASIESKTFIDIFENR